MSEESLPGYIVILKKNIDEAEEKPTYIRDCGKRRKNTGTNSNRNSNQCPSYKNAKSRPD